MAPEPLDLEDYLQLAACVLAVAIFIVALLAHRRRPTRRTLLLAVGFGLFALRGILLSVADFLVSSHATGDMLESFAVPLEVTFLLVLAGVLLKP